MEMIHDGIVKVKWCVWMKNTTDCPYDDNMKETNDDGYFSLYQKSPPDSADGVWSLVTAGS